MRRAYIHIGMPKTGTTAVQTVLMEQRDLLLQHGLFHPDTRDCNRPAILAHCHADAIDRNYLKRRKISQSEADALSAELWRQINAADGDIVISCEQLYRGEETAETIVRSFTDAGFDPVIVCYFRHPVDAAISAAQQAAKMGRRSLAESFAKPYWPRCKDNISFFVDTGAKIIARSYADAKKTGVPKDFLSSIEYETAAEQIDNVYSNKSLSMDGALLSEIYWKYVETYDKRPFRRKLVLKIDGPPFAIPETMRDAVREASQYDVDWVRDTFGIELVETPSDAVYYDRPRPEAFVELLHLMRSQKKQTR